MGESYLGFMSDVREELQVRGEDVVGLLVLSVSRLSGSTAPQIARGSSSGERRFVALDQVHCRRSGVGEY